MYTHINTPVQVTFSQYCNKYCAIPPVHNLKTADLLQICARSRSNSITEAPFLRVISAIALPSPYAPPVATATCPVNCCAAIALTVRSRPEWIIIASTLEFAISRKTTDENPISLVCRQCSCFRWHRIRISTSSESTRSRVMIICTGTF